MLTSGSMPITGTGVVVIVVVTSLLTMVWASMSERRSSSETLLLTRDSRRAMSFSAGLAFFWSIQSMNQEPRSPVQVKTPVSGEPLTTSRPAPMVDAPCSSRSSAAKMWVGSRLSPAAVWIESVSKTR